jgi:hypothetical protein
MAQKTFSAKAPQNKRGVEFKLSVEFAMPWALFLVLVHTITMLFNL